MRLQLANTSRISAEDLTVRLDFARNISIGLFELDDEERPETDSSARYSTVVGLVPPQDTVALPVFVIRIDKGLKQVNFSVRITGRNLPEVQAIPLTIQIGEQAEQDTPAAEAPAAT